jgi:hypothetical protein
MAGINIFRTPAAATAQRRRSQLSSSDPLAIRQQTAANPHVLETNPTPAVFLIQTQICIRSEQNQIRRSKSPGHCRR